MDKTALIALASRAQRDRLAACANVTPDQQARFDALMTKMTGALEAQDQDWFDAIVSKLHVRDDKSIANAIIRAAGPLCA